MQKNLRTEFIKETPEMIANFDLKIQEIEHWRELCLSKC
jgi:hypothetical protein